MLSSDLVRTDEIISASIYEFKTSDYTNYLYILDFLEFDLSKPFPF